ncbi:hypothetical protein GUJ93_ZPchr0001g32818 [Zizania palustris]|uniref:Uncharacterized protein n=1 Tax=Zizania palustris TaxID=103762 RepID=A0A8J5REE1_ZIZPA|nr:hypothetical protein GUJ93_ZPchr0001g32818 [Zizania palustris]
MTTFVPTAELMQVLADLQQVVAGLSAYLGLTLVASTLPSFPYGATSFPIVSSPPPRAPSDSKRATGEALNPIIVKKIADQQGKVTLVGSSVDDAALTTNKRAMEQGALVVSLPVAEAEAQGARRKGDAATGQTLAKLLLPSPRATSALDTRPVMRKTEAAMGALHHRDLGPDEEGPDLASDATRTDFPSLTREDVVPHGGASPPAATQASSALHGAASLPHVAPIVSEGGVWGRQRL